MVIYYVIHHMNVVCVIVSNSIQCGVSNGMSCNQFVAVGDYAMYGVKDIHIIGNNGNIYSTNGVSIDCQGIQSCKDTNIFASGISYIDCDGDNACQMAVMRIVNPKNGFLLLNATVCNKI